VAPGAPLRLHLPAEVDGMSPRGRRSGGMSTIDVAVHVVNGATFTLGLLYLVMRMWGPAAFAVCSSAALFAFHEWHRNRDRGQACGAPAHRDFVGAADVRCELPAGHQFHRNGTREWLP
jgi:hypothetical protein